MKRHHPRKPMNAALSIDVPATGTVPSEIVFIPEGEHRIRPSVNGKAEDVTVKLPPERGAAVAASLQAALDRRQRSNVRPWFDFEHKAGAASALPTSFRYEPGKGIIAAVEWTEAGRKAVQGKDFSYFSPVFYLAADGTPEDLPERGPLGALVNEPAFREIPRIAAADAVGAGGDGSGFVAAAARLIAAGVARTEVDAFALVAYRQPGLYAEYHAGVLGYTPPEPPRYFLRASHADEPGANASALLERAAALVSAGEAATEDEALIIACEREPELYDAYRSDLIAASCGPGLRRECPSHAARMIHASA